MKVFVLNNDITSENGKMESIVKIKFIKVTRRNKTTVLFVD